MPGELIPSFADAYKAANRQGAGHVLAEAYDATTILLKGIDSGNTTRPRWSTTSSLPGEGLRKHFKWDATGEHSPTTVYGYKVDDGKIVCERHHRVATSVQLPRAFPGARPPGGNPPDPGGPAWRTSVWMPRPILRSSRRTPAGSRSTWTLVEQVLEQHDRRLAYGAIYALVALGYTLVYGVLRLINFAHSEVFIVGAYAVFFTLSGLGFGPSAPPSWALVGLIGDLLLALVVGMLVSGGDRAVIVERVAYRPLRRRDAPPLVFLITAIGASFVDPVPDLHRRGPNAGARAHHVPAAPVFEIFGTTIDSQQIIIVVAALVLMVVADASSTAPGWAAASGPSPRTPTPRR